MCGIAGFFGRRWIEPAAVSAMHEALDARGPDARHAVLWDTEFHGTESAAQAALLHTRLSVRDLRAAADQPMSNAAGDLWISYNGEVYGWEAEAAQLKRRGYEFNTTSDTEFLLHAYDAWGMGFLERLRGMYAVALLDLRRRELYLIRDRLGIKPLVYYHRPGEIAFGSTVRAVLPYLEPSQRRLAPEGLDAYLAHRYVPAPRTVFEEIRRLRHGHYLRFDLRSGTLSEQCYWDARPDPRNLGGAIEEAVRLRTVADRPVGLFLSGGVDSSAVASVLAASGHREVASYTAAFPGTAYDESEQAVRVARALGLDSHVLPITQHIAEDFERIVADLDEPFADPSSVPLWYLARETSRHVRVVMGGDGGDELFAGYRRYAKHLRSAWRGRWRLSLPPMRPVRPPGRARKLADELRLDWVHAYSLRFSGMGPSLRRYLQPGVESLPATYWDGPRGRADASLGTLLAVDMDNYLPEYILRKADLCTMAHGLELRVPLLDHHLYQAVLALPPRERFTTPPKRALVAVCGVCRELGLLAQKKHGFNPPLAPWLRGALRHELSGLGAELEGLSGAQLRAGPVQALTDAYLAGAEARAEQVLQLVILRVSLRQLRQYGANRLH